MELDVRKSFECYHMGGSLQLNSFGCRSERVSLSVDQAHDFVLYDWHEYVEEKKGVDKSMSYREV